MEMTPPKGCKLEFVPTPPRSLHFCVATGRCCGSLRRMQQRWRHTVFALILWMDEIHVAPPKKPWNDHSPGNTHKQWLPMASMWCEMDFVHPQQDLLHPGARETWAAGSQPTPPRRLHGAHGGGHARGIGAPHGVIVQGVAFLRVSLFWWFERMPKGNQSVWEDSEKKMHPNVQFLASWHRSFLPWGA